MNTKIYINEKLCKCCGICAEFCPKKVLYSDELGKVKIAALEKCNACRLCEMRCPDFAIDIEDK
jgi:2-oxoglutarate ferredoxin oxidoreductase subunit delta